jgi:hypothetical protein
MELIRRNPRTAWRRYGADMLVVTIDDRMVHKLNETGMAVWEAVDGDGFPVESVVDKMETRFEAPRMEIAGDVETIVDAMVDKKILIREKAGVA